MPSTKEILTEVSMFPRFLTSRRGDIELTGTSGKKIIGIRGWLGGWNRDGLVRYSKEKGLKGILLDLGLQNGMVDSYVKKLCSGINRNPNSVIIGYSMGGVIALRYLQLHGASKIKKLILIGCPLNGASQAKRLSRIGGVYHDLSPQSKLLSELREFDPGSQTVHILAAWDQFVGDPQKIQGPGEKIVVPINGHVQLMNDIRHLGPVLDQYL